MNDQTPIYTQLLAAGSDPNDRTITFVVGTSPQEGVRLDIALGLVGPLMAAINAEALKLNADLTEDERLRSATLHANAVFLSQDSEGRPMIVFELSNRSMLPLTIKSVDNLAGFAAEMKLLSERPNGQPN